MTALSAGDWIADLSDKTLAAITSKYPNIAPEKLQEAYENFQLWRASLHASPPPQAMKLKLTRFGNVIDRFIEDIGAFEKTGLDELIRRSTPLDADRDAFDKLKRAALEAMLISKVCIPRAVLAVKKGKRPTELQVLVVELARVVKAAGYAVNARQNGALSQILGLILPETGEDHSDVRKIVKAALEKSGLSETEDSQKN